MKSPLFLLETIRAFMKSRILLTGVELDLFTQIDRGIDSVDALAAKKPLDPHALTRLLDSIVSLGYLKKENQHYFLASDAARLSSDRPETLVPMIRHMNELWNT